ERGPSVASARKGRSARAFELQIAAEAVPIDDFAEQHRAAITELRHELAELMAGIRLRKRFGRLRHAITCEHRNPFGPFEPLGVDAELLRERPVDPDQRGRLHGRRRTALEEPFRQSCESVIEANRQAALLVFEAIMADPEGRFLAGGLSTGPEVDYADYHHRRAACARSDAARQRLEAPR